MKITETYWGRIIALLLLVWTLSLAAPAAAQDTTPPSCAVAQLAATQGEASFAVHWSGADEAGGSGLSGLYRVQIQDAAAGTWSDWLTNATQTTATFTGLDGHTYYFQCAARDVAGNWTTLAATGFGDTSTIIKAQNLTIQTVNDGTGADANYTSSATTLSGNWSASSGAVGYSYAIGTAPGEANVLAWTETSGTSFTNSSLTLVHGTVYYVSVRAKTAADYYSDPFSSDGIVSDQTAPAAPSVWADAQIQSTSEIQAAWSASDAESGISGYEVSVGTVAGGADVSAWAPAGQAAVYTVTGLSLTAGGTYYVNVRAANGAGAVSAAGSSSAITVSGAIPAAPASVSDGTGADTDYTSSATQLSANWSAVAGATSYDYAIGTSPLGTDVVNWTSAGALTSVTATGLTLTPGSIYYISVRAVNGATPGPAVTTDGATVDTSAPSTPVVATPDLLTTNTTQLQASWIAEEPESAITLYEYAVGNTATTQDALGWTSAGTNTSATISNIALKVGEDYYIQVRATNGAGLVSSIGVSNAVIVSHNAGVTTTFHPAQVTAGQTAAGDADTQVTINFSESNGAGVDYQQLQLVYILDNGTEFEDPTRMITGAGQADPVRIGGDAGMSIDTAISIFPGGAVSHNFSVTIPEHVVTHAVAGRADASVTMRFIFTGTDSSHQRVTTIVNVPLKLTSHAAAASDLHVDEVAIMSPSKDQNITNPREFVARATIKTTGSGDIKGYWEIDGRPHHEFTEYAASGKDTELSVKLPDSLGGQHTLVLKIVMPEVLESAPVTFTVTDEIQGAAFTDFWAGDLHFTGVRAVFDEDLKAYSGSARLEYGILKLEADVPFSNLIIEEKGGRYELTGGALKTEINFNATHAALNISVDRLAVTTDGAQVDGRVHFEGADGLPGIGPLHFYGVSITADGISGSVSFPEKQAGSIGIFNISINSIHFTYDSSGLTLDAPAQLTFGDQDTAGGALDCVFSVSTSGAAVFRVGEQAYEKAGITDISSGLSNDLGLAGFTYHVVYGELTEKDGALALDAAGGALDMASALGSNAKLSIGNLSMIDTGSVTLTDISSPEFQLGPFTAQVKAQEITLALGQAPDMVLDFEITAPLGGQKLVLTADNVPVNKDGIRDADIAIKPAQGSDHVAELRLLNWADFKITSATLHVKDRKPEGMTLAASLTFDGKGFESDTITWDNGDWSGTLKAVGDPSFELAGVKVDFPSGSEIDLSLKGSGKDGRSAAVSFKNVSFDFSDLVGKPFKFTVEELSYADGAISADITLDDDISLAGLSLNVNKLHIDSPNPEGGKREIDALLGGTLTLDVGQEIKIGFDNMKVSSTGEIGGDISPGNATEFHLFGATFQITKVHLDKPAGGDFTFTMDGSIGFLDSHVDFTGMTYSQGKLNVHAEISESDPLRMPGLHFIGLTKLDVVDNKFEADGFFELPEPINKRIPLDNLVLDASGGLPDKIEIDDLTFTVDKFTVRVSKASFDFKTKTLDLDGDISLPDGYFDQVIPFQNVSLAMPEDSGQPAQADTSKATTSATDLKDTKHNLPLEISSFSIGIDPTHNSEWFLNMSGKLSVEVEGKGFHLDFQNYRIYSDMSMSLGKVSGGVDIGGFGVDISDLEIVDNVSDPYTQISGDMHMDSLGAADVKDLRVHKSGAVELEGVHLAMDYNAYKYDVSISYIDKTFKGDGKITFEGKELDVDALFGPSEWMLDIQAKGLDIELFPGVTLDKVGGGVHYWKTNNLLKFKIDCGLAIPEKDVLYGDVELDVATSGIIDISGDLKMFGTMPVGDAKIHIDIPNKTLAGTLHLTENIGGVVSADVTLDALFSPGNWYLQGNGNADVLGKLPIGSVAFRLDNSGFSASGHSNINVVVADAGFDFSVLITRGGSVSGSFHGHVDATLIGIIHVAGDLSASYANGAFDGSLGLSGCLDVCLPGCSWQWVNHCCCGFNYPCGCSWHWWGLSCNWCHTQICVPLYQPYNCSWCYSKIHKCAGITVYLRIDGGGIHAHL